MPLMIIFNIGFCRSKSPFTPKYTHLASLTNCLKYLANPLKLKRFYIFPMDYFCLKMEAFNTIHYLSNKRKVRSLLSKFLYFVPLLKNLPQLFTNPQSHFQSVIKIVKHIIIEPEKNSQYTDANNK